MKKIACSRFDLLRFANASFERASHDTTDPDVL